MRWFWVIENGCDEKKSDNKEQEIEQFDNGGTYMEQYKNDSTIPMQGFEGGSIDEVLLGVSYQQQYDMEQHYQPAQQFPVRRQR